MHTICNKWHLLIQINYRFINTLGGFVFGGNLNFYT